MPAWLLLYRAPALILCAHDVTWAPSIRRSIGCGSVRASRTFLRYSGRNGPAAQPTLNLVRVLPSGAGALLLSSGRVRVRRRRLLLRYPCSKSPASSSVTKTAFGSLGQVMDLEDHMRATRGYGELRGPGARSRCTMRRSYR